ncbi:SMI1/KNR4 family protein [Limnoglobus roseus]|uniref:SMI1/KNR4 family protein n=1 Tax=Limnoglobus roseus TaxID=2598579 RepID=A0A5C1AJ56_9BACT|nr:SMI1/KNR4 family protein [Limnoglobus roseus]QEL19489.1 SMI1/KNR4 family protein [Limnoglobus roseus]
MGAEIWDVNRFGPLTEDRLVAFESELGASFPDEYRAFLLQHNGGVPNRGTFNIPGEDGGERPFHCFFALHDAPWNDSTPEGSQGFPLQAALADFRADGGPAEVLPVGKDWSGSYVCVGLAGNDRGQVLYYDHGTEQLVRLADSLAAFVAGLREP